jgi:Icc-related predicted phosphoesterase
MDITFISDTHGIHDELKLPGGKVLIHSGDITEYGTEEEVVDFLHWFSIQPFIYKIFIAGNHDFFLEEIKAAKRNKIIPAGIIYLQNSGIEIDGLKIWGSPVTPYFLGMAFNVRPGKDIKKVWDKIPGDTDILITHGPPKDLLDAGIGCEELWERVNKVRPMVHCFGHAHGENGVLEKKGITYINSVLVNSLDPLKNEGYKITGKPINLKV